MLPGVDWLIQTGFCCQFTGIQWAGSDRGYGPETKAHIIPCSLLNVVSSTGAGQLLMLDGAIKAASTIDLYCPHRPIIIDELDIKPAIPTQHASISELEEVITSARSKLEALEKMVKEGSTFQTTAVTQVSSPELETSS